MVAAVAVSYDVGGGGGGSSGVAAL